MEPCDAARESGLAGARLADEGEALARAYHEVDVVQNLIGSVRRIHAENRDESVLDLDLGSRRRRHASGCGVGENRRMSDAADLVLGGHRLERRLRDRACLLDV